MISVISETNIFDELGVPPEAQQQEIELPPAVSSAADIRLRSTEMNLRYTDDRINDLRNIRNKHS